MEAFLKHNFTIPVPIEVKVIRTKVDRDTCESIIDFADQYKKKALLIICMTFKEQIGSYTKKKVQKKYYDL